MTGIEWTDETWNPVRGCTRVSEGCRHCYAETMAARFSAPGEPFAGFATRKAGEARWTGKVALQPDRLDIPLRWWKPRRVFVNSMSDLFHESLPDEAIDRVFAVMALAQRHTFQVLTKRSARMRDYFAHKGRRAEVATAGARWMDGLDRDGDFAESAIWDRGWPLPNVWLGVSVEDQEAAANRIPDLLGTPAAVRWVSAEPLLGPLDLHKIWSSTSECIDALAGEVWLAGAGSINSQTLRTRERLDWVVVGGESGPGARPMDPAWARAIRDQCKAAGVAFFMKQMSGPAKSRMPRIPDDLMIRQWPGERSGK